MCIIGRKKHIKQLRQLCYNDDLDKLAEGYLYLQALLRLKPLVIDNQEDANRMFLTLIYNDYFTEMQKDEPVRLPIKHLDDFYDDLFKRACNKNDYETRCGLHKYTLINTIWEIHEYPSNNYIFLLQDIFNTMVMNDCYTFDRNLKGFLYKFLSILWYYINIAIEERGQTK